MAENAKAEQDQYESIKRIGVIYKGPPKRQTTSSDGYDDAYEEYGKHSAEAQAAYENLAREARINKALLERAGRQTDRAAGITSKAAALTIGQRNENNLRNTLGSAARQYEKYRGNVEHALNNLKIQEAADEKSAAARMESEKSANRLRKGRADAELGLQRKYLDLKKRESDFNKAYQLFTNRMIKKGKFKSITGITVRNLPRPRVFRNIFTDMKKGAGLFAQLAAGTTTGKISDKDRKSFIEKNKAAIIKKYGKFQYDCASSYYNLKNCDTKLGNTSSAMQALNNLVGSCGTDKEPSLDKFYKEFKGLYKSAGSEVSSNIDLYNSSYSYAWLEQYFPSIMKGYQYTDNDEDRKRKKMGIAPAAFDINKIAVGIRGYEAPGEWTPENVTDMLRIAESRSSIRDARYEGNIINKGISWAAETLGADLSDPFYLMGGTERVTQRVESMLKDPESIDADDADFIELVVNSINNKPDYITNNMDEMRAKQLNDLGSLLSSGEGTAAYGKACELKGFELANKADIDSESAAELYHFDEFLTSDSARKQEALDEYVKTHPDIVNGKKTITVGGTDYQYDLITGLFDDNGDSNLQEINNRTSKTMAKKSLDMELDEADKTHIQWLRDNGCGEVADLIDAKEQGGYVEVSDSTKQQLEEQFIEWAEQDKEWDGKFEISSAVDQEVRKDSDFDAVVSDIPDVVGNWNPYFQPSADDMYGAIRTGYDINQMPAEADEGFLDQLEQGLKDGTITQAQYDDLKKQHEDNIKSTEDLRAAWSGYGFITKDMLDTFTYLYKKGKETGDYNELYEYFDIFESELTNAQYGAYYGRMKELVKEEGPWGEILSGVAATGGSFMAPAAYLETGIEALTGQEGSTTSPRQLMARSAGDFNELAASTSEGFGKFLITAGLNFVQNLPSYAMGPAGAFYSAAQAAGMDAAQQKLSGATPAEAFGHATVIGTIEYLSDKIPFDGLEQVIKGIPVKGFAKTIIGAAGHAGIEFTQEAMTSIVENLADTMIAGDRSQYSQLVRQNINQGMTEQEARYSALYTLFIDQPVNEGLIGAFTSGFSSKIETATSRIKADTANYTNTLAAVNEAMRSGKMTESEKAALKEIQAEAEQGLTETESAREPGKSGDGGPEGGLQPNEDGSDDPITATEISEPKTTEAENTVSDAIDALDKLGIDTEAASKAYYDYLTASAEAKPDALIKNADAAMSAIDSAIIMQQTKGLDTSALEFLKARVGQIKQSFMTGRAGIDAGKGERPSAENAMADEASALIKLPLELQAKVNAEAARQAFYDSLTTGKSNKTGAQGGSNYGDPDLPVPAGQGGALVTQNFPFSGGPGTSEVAGAAAGTTLSSISKSQNALPKSPEYPALPDEGYNDYAIVLGKNALSFEKYIELKNLGGEEWNKLQTDYTIKKITKAFKGTYPDAVVLESGDPVPPELSQAADNLYYSKQQGIYHYTEHDVGVEINKYLGGVKGIRLTGDEITIMEETAAALGEMSLPLDMIVYRGCSPVTFSGLERLKGLDTDLWIGKPLETKGFTSTSVYPDTAYDREVIAIIHIPGGQKGAGYVNDISFNLKNGLPQEFEVILQKNSRYIILDAYHIGDKIILELEWLGYAGK